jgi:hypothetical protein
MDGACVMTHNDTKSDKTVDAGLDAALEPCPFCGGKAERCQNSLTGLLTMAQCRQCGATAFDAKWNRRAALPHAGVSEEMRADAVDFREGIASAARQAIIDAAHRESNAAVRSALFSVEVHVSLAISNAIRSALVPTTSPAPLAWPEAKVMNPDIANPTGVPYLDCLLHRLLDAQQDVNLEANERMSQPLCDASALVDEVENCIRKFAFHRAALEAAHLPTEQPSNKSGNLGKCLPNDPNNVPENENIAAIPHVGVSEETRDQFEAWAAKDRRDLAALEFEERTPDNNHYYEDDSTNNAYIGWCAALSSQHRAIEDAENDTLAAEAELRLVRKERAEAEAMVAKLTDQLMARAAHSSQHAEAAPVGWLDIDDEARAGKRILLLWKPFGGISEHVELGWWSSAKQAWTNTYGKPFNGDPDKWAPLAPFSPVPADAGEPGIKADDGLTKAIAFVRKRLDDYVSEHGMYDPETGATEFPGNGDETVYEWEEIIEGLEALREAKP